MIQKQTHIIDRQVFDLQFASASVAKQAQRDVQEINAAYLAPMINELLDQWFSPDEVITIQKLELDLGNISLDEDADEWMRRIKTQLEEKLLPFANNKKQLEANFFAEKQHIKDHLLDAFVFFIQNGALPQHSIFESVDAIKRELLLMDRAQQQGLHKALLLLPEELLLQRVISNFNWEELAFVLQVFQPGISLKEWIEILATAREQLENYHTTIVGDPKGIAQTIAKHKQQFLLQFVKTVIKASKSFEAFSATKAWEWRDVLINNIQAGAAKTERIDVVKEIVKDEFEQVDDTQTNAKAQWINNAGLCLLYPWLQNFFETLGICSKGSFVSRERQEHAIYLLHYMATKEEDATEEKLLFPKLLCGWPWQMPSINSIPISKEEKEETEILLQSVIDHWKILKHTSVDGLREAFLQRGANLVKQEDHFLLQPEQQGIDVLIDHIPWGFGNILFPWMKMRIVVEWY